MKATLQILTALVLGASMMILSGCGDDIEIKTTQTTETPMETTNLAFGNKSNAELDTYYTTNVVTIVSVDGTVTVKTDKGSIVVNGVDRDVAEFNVVNGNTVAIKVRSSGSYSTAITVRVEAGGAVDFFSVTTKADTSTPDIEDPDPTPQEQCEAMGGFWDGTECFG